MNSELPFVSIVMPVRNEGAYLEKSLESVLKQDYPNDKFEIIVADGMSIDNTREIIQQFQKENKNLKLIDNELKIVSTGLNKAMSYLQGSIIVRVDGHCEIAPDYVRRAVDFFEKHPEVAGVGGPIETVGKDFISKAIALAMSSKFGVGGSSFRTVKNKEVDADTIAFPVYRRTVMEKVGPYDEELVRNQDDEYNYRLRKAGYKLVLSPNIRSRYYSRATLKKLFRQYFQYGYWKVRVLQKHPAQIQLRQYIPFFFVFFLTVLAIQALFNASNLSALFFLIFCYIGTGLAASLIESYKNGWNYFFILPVVYAALHFGYGIGFAVGIIKFSDRWRWNEK